jgi:hypothetical protein
MRHNASCVRSAARFQADRTRGATTDVGAVDLRKGEAERLNEALGSGLTVYTCLRDELLS